MHGLDCLVELLGFELSLIKSGGEGVYNDLNVFGLDLLVATLSAGKSAFAQHEMMMSLIREDLFQAVLHLAKTSNLACLSGVTQVALGLYVHLGPQLLLQLEAYLNLVLLRVAEGKGPGGSDHQEAALEVMLQVTPHASSAPSCAVHSPDDQHAVLCCLLSDSPSSCRIMSHISMPHNRNHHLTHSLSALSAHDMHMLGNTSVYIVQTDNRCRGLLSAMHVCVQHARETTMCHNLYSCSDAHICSW